jgi:hypothetical protein
LVTEKTMRFTNKNLDLDRFSQRIVEDLDREGFATQKSKGPHGIVIQAQKENLLRDLVTAERCFTILVSGQPNDLTVRVGIGKWAQNLAVAIVEAVLTGGLFLAVDIPEVAWNSHLQYDIMDDISRIAEGRPLAKNPELATAET